jgi:hypothetical protein
MNNNNVKGTLAFFSLLAVALCFLTEIQKVYYFRVLCWQNRYSIPFLVVLLFNAKINFMGKQ